MPTTLPPTSSDLLGGRWWRWTAYEVGDGIIRRAPTAKLEVYDSWADYQPAGRRSGGAPYQSLLTLIGRTDERDLTRRLAEWCSEHGLLGVLPHSVVQIVLPRGRVPAGLDRPRRELHRAGPVVYTRFHWGWRWYIASRAGLPAGVVVHGVGRGVWAHMPLKFLSRFFPTVPARERGRYPYPPPFTEAFWRLYAERVEDFLHAARTLRDALDDIKARRDRERRRRGIDALNALVAPIGPALAPDLSQRWRSPSLLTSFAMMALLDFVGRPTVLACQACGTPFVPRGYQSAFCTPTCRRRIEQQRRRDRQRRDATGSAAPDRTSGDTP